jgi:hypothetical protein
MPPEKLGPVRRASGVIRSRSVLPAGGGPAGRYVCVASPFGVGSRSPTMEIGGARLPRLVPRGGRHRRAGRGGEGLCSSPASTGAVADLIPPDELRPHARHGLGDVAQEGGPIRRAQTCPRRRPTARDYWRAWPSGRSIHEHPFGSVRGPRRLPAVDRTLCASPADVAVRPMSEIASASPRRLTAALPFSGILTSPDRITSGPVARMIYDSNGTGANGENERRGRCGVFQMAGPKYVHPTSN